MKPTRQYHNGSIGHNQEQKYFNIGGVDAVSVGSQRAKYMSYAGMFRYAEMCCGVAAQSYGVCLMGGSTSMKYTASRHSRRRAGMLCA